MIVVAFVCSPACDKQHCLPHFSLLLSFLVFENIIIACLPENQFSWFFRTFFCLLVCQRTDPPGFFPCFDKSQSSPTAMFRDGSTYVWKAVLRSNSSVDVSYYCNAMYHMMMMIMTMVMMTVHNSHIMSANLAPPGPSFVIFWLNPPGHLI